MDLKNSTQLRPCSSAVDYSLFGNHVINFLVSWAGGNRVDDLKFISQSHDGRTFANPLQQPIIPALSPSQAIAKHVEGYAGNKNCQRFKFRFRQSGRTGRLENAIPAGPQLIRRSHSKQPGAIIPADPRVENFL